MYREEDHLLISGLQHFAFCRRQWALIHVEQQWEENYRTADGRVMHKNAHDSGFHEKRGNIITARGMQVSSAQLGISGECDIVEFHQAENGITLHGIEGTYKVIVNVKNNLTFTIINLFKVPCTFAHYVRYVHIGK